MPLCCSNPSKSSPFQSSKSQSPHKNSKVLQDLSCHLLFHSDPIPYYSPCSLLQPHQSPCCSLKAASILLSRGFLPGMFVSQVASSSPLSLSKCYLFSKSSKSTLFKIVDHDYHILYPSLSQICFFPLDLLSFNNCKFNLFTLLTSVFPLKSVYSVYRIFLVLFSAISTAVRLVPQSYQKLFVA